MIKLLDIVKNIINEGASLEGDKVIFSKDDNPSDYLFHTAYSDKIKNNYVAYSFSYNDEQDGNITKTKVADAIKQLKLDPGEEKKLFEIIKNDIKFLIPKVDIVYSLGSGAPLSEAVKKLITEMYNIPGVSVDKVKFEDPLDMLLPNYKAIIEKNINSSKLAQNKPKESIQKAIQNTIKSVEAEAKAMFKDTGGVIKSSGRYTKARPYFKVKYDLSKIIKPEKRTKILFVDDNVQTGKDFADVKNYVEENFGKNADTMFYVPIKLPKASATDSESTRRQKKKEKEKKSKNKTKVPIPKEFIRISSSPGRPDSIYAAKEWLYSSYKNKQYKSRFGTNPFYFNKNIFYLLEPNADIELEIIDDKV